MSLTKKAFALTDFSQSLAIIPFGSRKISVASCAKSGACIDLQWFAKAEDEGRTEEASEHKIRKAREEGRVAKSQELNSGLVLLLPVIALIICAPWVLTNCIKVIRFYFDRCAESEFTDRGLAIAFFVYGMKITPVICTLINLFIANVVVDYFLQGIKNGYKFEIITDKPDELARELMESLHHGVTEIRVEGMYSRTDKFMIVCIIRKKQIGQMMKILKKHKGTFASFSKVNEVFGRFRK